MGSSPDEEKYAKTCARCKDRSPVCFKCKGEVWQRCSHCGGTGELKDTLPCWCAWPVEKSRASGKMPELRAASGDCNKCLGTGAITRYRNCGHCWGAGLWQCEHCSGRGLFPCSACGRGKLDRPSLTVQRGAQRAEESEPPPRGVTVKRCSETELEQVRKLWRERGGQPALLAVWSVENPLLTYRYRTRRSELALQLGRSPAELRGFHGSSSENILSIVENGFDAGRRCGQAFGAGEYFAKDPSVSIAYCGGASCMLMCQLCLGMESSLGGENKDGDHIWVPEHRYYIISGPAQALPLYIVCFETNRSPTAAEKTLIRALAQPAYRAGAAEDEKAIDLQIPGLGGQAEALPAAWWNGDLESFKGVLQFDVSNPHGALPMSKELAENAVLLLRRGGGKFAVKVENATKAGAEAILIVQSSPEPLITMKGLEEPALAAAMISQSLGEELITLATEAKEGKSTIVTASRRSGDGGSLPANRPCAMTAESTDALWLGFLQPHFSDKQLAADVHRFLAKHAAVPCPDVRIVRGKFTQAKVSLSIPMKREAVRALNSQTFVECGVEQTVTVDDAHGSPHQRCPRSIAGYCRGRNLRFIDPCWCMHDGIPTKDATFSKTKLDLQSAKGDEISTAFLRSAPFHDGQPVVLAISAIHNPRLGKQHEFYRRYLAQKNGKAPKQVELYHGTNMNIVDTVYTHGLFPPSDMEASEECPVSGGKRLRTSLCDNSCKSCKKRHLWEKCHMFGLGIYLGDLAQKSHRYVSGRESQSECKMLICSVLLGEALQVEGHLKCGDAMHNMHSLRALQEGAMMGMVDRADGEKKEDKGPDQKDILFIKGLRGNSRPGFSVYNSEYISFHPYQCLPLYEISYRVGI